jgi:hypothetical protein
MKYQLVPNGETEFYEYDDEARELLCKLQLKEDDLGRFRCVCVKDYDPRVNSDYVSFGEKVISGRFIVVETRDGIYRQKNHLSPMVNHPKFSHITTYGDKSYLDYWFKLD